MGRVYIYIDIATPPARRVQRGTRYAPGTEKDCRVGRAWSHREAAGGQVELGSRSCFLGIITKKKKMEDPFRHHYYYYYYYYRAALYSKDNLIWCSKFTDICYLLTQARQQQEGLYDQNIILPVVTNDGVMRGTEARHLPVHVRSPTRNNLVLLRVYW